MARNLITALVASVALAAGLAACGEKEETVETPTTTATVRRAVRRSRATGAAS